MAIADRGFCDLWTLAEKKFYSIFSAPLLKYTTMGWQAQNSFNFLKFNPKKPCYKVVMCDIADEMIDVHCSFMVGLVNELSSMQSKLKSPQLNRPGILDEKQCRTLIDSVLYLLNVDLDLATILLDHENIL